MKKRWKPSYNHLVSEFIELHFGESGGIAKLFPYMKPNFKWKDKKELPFDVRTVCKTNNEYHGLERHARQYHVTAQYEYSYHYWLIAACWRRENMMANRFADEGHKEAIEFDLRSAEYNKALAEWQRCSPKKYFPEPEDFGLDSEKTDEINKMTEIEMEQIRAKHLLPKS